MAQVVDAVLSDPELRDRCRDLLTARRNYDRVVREATTILDDRLKRLSGVARMNAADLVGKVLNPDPERAVIELSGDPNEQRGMHGVCNGIMLAFRNKAHHSLSDSFAQQDALKFCGFIDTLLTIVGKGVVHKERI